MYTLLKSIFEFMKCTANSRNAEQIILCGKILVRFGKILLIIIELRYYYFILLLFSILLNFLKFRFFFIPIIILNQLKI